MQLGQALSIRPDILSPAAMNELQKLCDKVPSFNNAEAMQVIHDELGAPWHEVRPYPSPPVSNNTVSSSFLCALQRLAACCCSFWPVLA